MWPDDPGLRTTQDSRGTVRMGYIGRKLAVFDPNVTPNDHIFYYLSFFWFFDHDITFNRSRSFAIFSNAHIYACVTHSRSSDFELTNTQTPTHLILWIIDNFNLFRVKNYVNPGSSNTYKLIPVSVTQNQNHTQ